MATQKTAKLLKTIFKALLRAMQDQRDVLHCCIDVLIGPAADPVFEKMSAQTKEYSKLSKEAKEAAGSPNLLAFEGLFNAIIEKGSAVGQAKFTAIKEYSEKVAHMAPTELNHEVRLCKSAKCCDSADRKVYLELSKCQVSSWWPWCSWASDANWARLRRRTWSGSSSTGTSTSEPKRCHQRL